MTTAVERAAQELSYTDRSATVVLLSDGLESCERDPCALADTLERSGVGFTAHFVGFGLGADADAASLTCLAERTGGRYIAAGNAGELGEALRAVGAAVPAAPVAKPQPEPQPEPQYDITISGPATGLAASRIEVSWIGAVSPTDYVTIVPAGADDDAYARYVNVDQDTKSTLQAPIETGLYELRYVLREGRRVLASQPIEVLVADAAITQGARLAAPETAAFSATIQVGWSVQSESPDRRITLVRKDQADFTWISAVRLDGDAPVEIDMPKEAGVYEFHFLDVSGMAVRARKVITVR